MKTIVFDDDNFDRAKQIAHTLSEAGMDVIVRHSCKCYNHTGSEVECWTKADLVLYHQRNEASLRRTTIDAVCSLSYSGGPGADIPRPFASDSCISREEADHIASAVNEGIMGLRERILWIWTSREEALALRLLCEAWKYVGDAQTRVAIVNADGTPSLTISSPRRDPEKWFKPFGGQETAINHITETMGEARHEAQQLLDACKSGSGPTEDLVTNFLVKVQC